MRCAGLGVAARLTGCRSSRTLLNWGIFSRTADGPRYLVLESSQAKADAFFGGHRFWQIPGTSMRRRRGDGRPVAAWAHRVRSRRCGTVGGRDVSTIFNRRFDAIQMIPAFAAEVVGLPEPRWTMSAIRRSLRPSESNTARTSGRMHERVEELVTYRALLDGFAQLRNYITECSEPRGEFRLA